MLFMNKSQYTSISDSKERLKRPIQNPLFSSSTKQQIFSAHLTKLNRSNDQSAKQSKLTLTSDYQNTFQNYHKNYSLIDRIVETFDYGNIQNLSQKQPDFIHSYTYMHLPLKIKQNIQQLNHLYFVNDNQRQQFSYCESLTYQNYAKALSQLKQKHLKIEQIKQSDIIPKNNELNKPTATNRSQTVATKNQIQSKLDTLLNQIYSQKKKIESPEYMHEMQIKLNQFIDYVLLDDDKYIGLSLQDKAHQIIKEINKFKGKTIDGWLVLVLIEIFFQEFKQLSTMKLQILRIQKKKQESKHEVKSEIDAKSQKSNNSSIKKGKYSEHNSRRRDIQQQDWIGDMK